MTTRWTRTAATLAAALSLATATSVAHADRAAEAAEEAANKQDAVSRVVASHDTTLVVDAGHLILKQEAIRSARALLAEWGREAQLGDRWKSSAKQWKAAEADLIAGADALVKTQFSGGAGLRAVWTSYMVESFGGEEADVIANHFSTQSGKEQLRSMDWFIGEMVLFNYTYTGRFEYDLVGAEAELKAIQKSAAARAPVKDVELDFSSKNPEAFQFIACSPDSRYCPGPKYAKLIAIPILGGLIRHIDEVRDRVDAQLRARRADMQPYFDAFRRGG
jgi:hypothetical protein